MPPRLAVSSLVYRPAPQRLSVASFLVPFVQCLEQQRAASILSSLSDTPGAYNKRIRRGRGPASGKGKTSGRGHKGQKQHGKVPRGFNGGQTPDHIVHGSRGFKNVFSVDLARLNVDRIQEWIDQGRLDSTKPITIKELHESRCTHGIKDGVKLLARNASKLTSPIHITVSRASAGAIAAVEAAGGMIQTRYYTEHSIKRVLRGHTHPTHSLLSPPLAATPPRDIMPTVLAAAQQIADPKTYRYRLPDPAARRDIEYYRDPAHRGYLSYQLKENESPSLFFRSPAEGRKATGSASAGQKPKEKATPSAERLW